MTRWALRRATDKVEREWNDDNSFRRDMIDASPCATGLVSRVTRLLAATALVGGVGLAAPVAAQVSNQPTAVVYTMTPERIAALVAVGVGLIGAVIGAGSGSRRRSYRHRQRAPRGHRGPGDGADRPGYRWAGRGRCRRWCRHRQRGSRRDRINGGGAGRHGPRRAGSGPLAAYRLTEVPTPAVTL